MRLQDVQAEAKKEVANFNAATETPEEKKEKERRAAATGKEYVESVLPISSLSCVGTNIGRIFVYIKEQN
jgi:hypothetical protein